jgi:hypothetical protein
MFERLERDMIPLSAEALDHLTRVFGSSINTPTIRSTAYRTLCKALELSGPTLVKQSVNMVEPVILACCRDIQEDVGYLKTGEKPKASAADNKKNGTSSNADLFLQTAASSSVNTTASTLTPEHRSAASALLPHLLSSLPQELVRPSVRAIIDQTAILTGNREAMVASVLNPYKDSHGKAYASILPHLTQQFPNDQALDVLRTNLRTDGVLAAEDLADAIEAEEEQEGEDDVLGETEDASMDDAKPTTETLIPTVHSMPASVPIPAAPAAKIESKPNPFEPSHESSAVPNSTNEVASPPPPKRKNSSPDIVVPAKRQDVGEKGAPRTVPVPAEAESGDSDDESVHLNMEFEDDDDDDE